MGRWWWMGLLTLACSVRVEDYGRRYAQARCEREQRCGSIAKAVDCTRPDLFADTFPEQPLLNAGLVSYSAIDAAACLQRLRDTTCTTPVSLMPDCRRTFQGTLGEGAACQDSPAMTCAAGLVCGAQSSCGTCIVATGEDQRWTPGRPCDVGLFRYSDGGVLADSICVRARGLEQRCSPGIFCERWLRCTDAGVCAFPEPLVSPDGGGFREAGEPCGTGQVPCKEGLRCVAASCSLLLSNGVRCDDDADCLSGRCFERRCTAKVPEGGACTLDGDCAELPCIAGRCDGAITVCR
ncbi:MAG: hypothetical protein Q8L48_27580 [Archangium sp.]|nr:hypothetical protein [Archangium sp.]